MTYEINNRPKRHASKSAGRSVRCLLKVERRQSELNSGPTRSNSINCLTDVKQLDGLMRAFVLTADTLRTAGLKNEHNWTHYVWLAVACVKRILTVSTSSTARTLQALRRAQPGELESVKSPKSAIGKGKSNPPEINSDRTHAKNVVDHLPKTVNEWSTFEIPDNQLRIWQSALEQTQTESHPVETITRKSHAKDKQINVDSRVTTTTTSSGSSAALGPLVIQQINRSTFPSPLVSMASLTRLLELITQLGPAQHGFAVLVLQDCLTRPIPSTSSALDLSSTCLSGNQLVRLK
ncbi:hypothetical protein PHET_06896 [Paragonimus heterotremus]|uniref:Uncharacterized protein n=1 Tax=Paragonimus heterotremus TaxID=100268 RepID=A0A8J4TIN3_9TREM|nr:hypothetical protein PHET_06896 [Paragonimus heterotremus]